MGIAKAVGLVAVPAALSLATYTGGYALGSYLAPRSTNHIGFVYQSAKTDSERLVIRDQAGNDMGLFTGLGVLLLSSGVALSYDRARNQSSRQ